MLAYFFAILLAFIVGIFCALTGAPPGTTAFIIIVNTSLFSFLGVAHAWNRSQRHAAKGTAAEAPILDSSRIAQVETAPLERADQLDRSNKSLMPETMIGKMVNGRLLLSLDELRCAVEAPLKYANLVFVTNPPRVGEAVGENWYLALGPNSGVFFNADRSQVWSVTPATVRVPNSGKNRIIPVFTMPVVESIDGRKQKIHVGHWHLITLLAWKSDSYSTYLKDPGVWPAGWGLWAYEFLTKSQMSSVFGWECPQRTTIDAIDELARDSQLTQRLLAEIAGGPTTSVSFTKVRTMVDAFEERLREEQIPESHPIFGELAKYRRRKARKQRVIIAAVLISLLGTVVWLVYFFSTNRM